MTVSTSFSAAPYLREIGRGKEGARSLNSEQAQTLMAAVLRGQVSELELGALLIALRVKGESAEELIGFMHAVQQVEAEQPPLPIRPLLAQSQQSGLPVVVLPSYNGARRRPNFTPALAALIASRGYPVLVHGLAADPTGRVNSAQVFQLMDWQGTELVCPPVFVDIAEAFPALHQLLAVRQRLGVRNCAHTLVKFWVPNSLRHSILITSYTHPEFWHLQRQVLSALDQTALVLRGHEGEPVASPHRLPRMDGVKSGQTWTLAEPDAVMAEQPQVFDDISAAASVQWVHHWLSNPHAVPSAISAQLDALDRLCHAAI